MQTFPHFSYDYHNTQRLVPPQHYALIIEWTVFSVRYEQEPYVKFRLKGQERTDFPAI